MVTGAWEDLIYCVFLVDVGCIELVELVNIVVSKHLGDPGMTMRIRLNDPDVLGTRDGNPRTDLGSRLCTG